MYKRQAVRLGRGNCCRDRIVCIVGAVSADLRAAGKNAYHAGGNGFISGGLSADGQRGAATTGQCAASAQAGGRFLRAAGFFGIGQ